MCSEIKRVTLTIAVALNILCIRGENASFVTMSPLPQLEQVKENVLRLEAVRGVQPLLELNFLVGVASLGAFYENHTKCGQELEIMLNAIARRKVWGLKVLDSFGSPPKTFTWGNYFWFGTPDLCEDLNHPFAISLSHSQPPIFNASSPFPVQFIIVYMNFTTPYYIDIKLSFDNLIHLGLCMPKSCSISKITLYTDAYFQLKYFQMQRNFMLNMKALDAKAPHFSWYYFVKTGTLLFINWWYNLLYIHNLLDMNNICCSWTWYLACEMQYFILFTGLLFVHVKKPIAAKIAFVTLALGFVVVGWMCNFASGITFEIDVIYSTLNQLYVKPWVRIPPYLGGATMGWLMHQLQQRQQKHQQQQEQLQKEQLQHAEQQAEHQTGINTETHHPQDHQQQHNHNHNHNLNRNRNHHQHQYEHVRTFGRKAFWFFSLALYVTTNFMSYWRSTPSWVVATIMSMGKLLFALCIGGVIIMCACGRGGCLNVLLSARPFLFLNKFCFSIYMMAPVVVVAMFGLRNEPTNFTEVGSGADFFTVIVLSIMSAFLMLMLIELPMQRIANLLLKQKKT